MYAAFELTDDAIASMERATLEAVAPTHLERLDGWLLPFDASSIGRATSAVPLRHRDLDITVLPHILRRYGEQGMVPAFRLADGAGLAPWHQALRRHGYAPQQPTLVQTASVAQLLEVLGPNASDGVALRNAPYPAWSAVYTAPGFDPVDGAQRVAVLSRSDSAWYASLAHAGVALAAGVCATGAGWASIHGMRTVHTHRGQGLAGQILAAMAGKAQECGLAHFFLQVEEDNPAARALYQRLGFVTAWRYQYWRPA